MIEEGDQHQNRTHIHTHTHTHIHTHTCIIDHPAQVVEKVGGEVKGEVLQNNLPPVVTDSVEALCVCLCVCVCV